MIDPRQQQDGRLIQVAPLTCIECAREWLDSRERWRIYLTPDEVSEPVLYCADCASYEFDGS
jgi:hypothetical protein